MSETRRNYFFWNKVYFEDAVRQHVCAVCPFRAGEGDCSCPDPRGCAVFRYLPQLVMTAQHLADPTLESYREALERDVKMECGSLMPGPSCRFRDTLECGLSECLPILLQAVEEEDALLEARKGFDAGVILGGVP